MVRHNIVIEISMAHCRGENDMWDEQVRSNETDLGWGIAINQTVHEWPQTRPDYPKLIATLKVAVISSSLIRQNLWSSHG